MPKIPSLPTAPAISDSDLLVVEDVSTGITSKATIAVIKAYLGVDSTWTPVSDTWTYASADAPNYVVTVPSGATNTYAPGMRVQLTHGATVKYFIIVAVTSTSLTLYGGTDYTLSGTTISNVSFSANKAPLGFPLNPDKWTVSLTDTSLRLQASPANGTWYNLGSLSLAIPIGSWNLEFTACLKTDKASGTGLGDSFLALSTSASSSSDDELCGSDGFAIASGAPSRNATIYKRKAITLAAKTTYYFVAMSNGTLTDLMIDGRVNNGFKTIMRAISAYL